MHALRWDIPTINAELQRSGFSVCSSADFFCDFGQVAGTRCTCVPQLLLGNNKPLPQRENSPMVGNSTNTAGTRGEWELRAPSVSNIPEEWNSIATVECTRESVHPSSVDCPLQSWARWFGRKIEQMRIARKTEDWQFIYCSFKWFNGFVSRLNKTNACKEHKFCFINKNHKHRIVCVFFGSKLEFWGPFQPELFYVTCQRWRKLQVQIFHSVLFWTGQSIGMSFFLLSWQETLKGIPNVSSSAKCYEKCSN